MQGCVQCTEMQCRELMPEIMVSKAAGYESCLAAALYSNRVVQVSQGI